MSHCLNPTRLIPRQCTKTFTETTVFTSNTSSSVSCVSRTTCTIEAAIGVDAVRIDITVVCPVITFVHIYRKKHTRGKSKLSSNSTPLRDWQSQFENRQWPQNALTAGGWNSHFFPWARLLDVIRFHLLTLLTMKEAVISNQMKLQICPCQLAQIWQVHSPIWQSIPCQPSLHWPWPAQFTCGSPRPVQLLPAWEKEEGHS